jgi:hypothetical protein
LAIPPCSTIHENGGMMVDFTMCGGVDCPIKEKCLRYLSTPSENQSYFYERWANDGCIYFMPIKDEKKGKRES